MQKAADDAVSAARLPHRPGDRRPGDGRARHRRRHGAGAVAADGQGQGGRRDLPQLRRAQEVRRRQRLPGRLDVQGRSSSPPPSSRASRSAPRSPRRRRCTSTTRTSRTATAPTPATARAGTPAELDRRGHLRPLLRHAAVGEHLLRPARDADRACASRCSSPRTWASRCRSAQKVPSWILGVSDTDPLDDGRRPTPPSPPAACTATPARSPQVLDSQGQPSRTSRSKCEQVMPGATADAVNDILRGVMEPGGFGPAPRARQAVRRQDRHQQRQHGGVVRRLHAQARHRRDGRRRQRAGRSGSRLNGQTVGGSYIYAGLRLHRGRPDLGRGDGRGLRQARLRGLPDAARRRDRRRADDRARRRPGMSRRAAATATLEAAGFTVADGGQVNSEVPAQGLVAYTSPGGGTSLSSGDTVDALHLHRLRPAARRHRGGNGGNGGGGGNDGGGGNGNGNGNGAAARPAAAGSSRSARAGGVPPRRPRHRPHGP